MYRYSLKTSANWLIMLETSSLGADTDTTLKSWGMKCTRSEDNCNCPVGVGHSVPFDPQVILHAWSPCTFSELELGTLTHLAGIKCPEVMKLEFVVSHSKLQGEGSRKDAISACVAPAKRASRNTKETAYYFILMIYLSIPTKIHDINLM